MKQTMVALRKTIKAQQMYIEFLHRVLKATVAEREKLDDENWELRFGETKFESMRRG